MLFKPLTEFIENQIEKLYLGLHNRNAKTPLFSFDACIPKIACTGPIKVRSTESDRPMDPIVVLTTSHESLEPEAGLPVWRKHLAGSTGPLHLIRFGSEIYRLLLDPDQPTTT